ncbi:hypothetical protein [Nocardiopsis sp. CC223A]|uniref:hypothetical protein n=1 Tax=Nocardiopsis sp. CC223A TaxID=3044051 RepID=UPI00278BBB05|nr:hypothetical protein [Nocardiopsis sp. CC223A]
MPPLHQIMNIVADADEDGTYPPMPSVNTIIGPDVKWVDGGRYHFARTTKWFVGFEFGEMNRWWRYLSPDPGFWAWDGWDYAGYTMQEELWSGPGSVEWKFREALAKLATVIPNSINGAGSSTFHWQPVGELIGNLNSLITVLGDQSENMYKAYNELDVPEGPMTGAAASAYAARLYDFGARLEQLRDDVKNNHDAIDDILAPVKSAAEKLQLAVEQALGNPATGMGRILDDWYFHVSAGSEEWYSPRGQFRIRINDSVMGIVGDSITDYNVNQELKHRWQKGFQGVIDAANDLYNSMNARYGGAFTSLDPIETPEGDIPFEMIPDINDIDNPYGGGGDGPPDPLEIDFDWGDGPPGPQEIDFDWGDGPSGEGPPELNYEDPGDGPETYTGGPEDETNYGGGGPGPEIIGGPEDVVENPPVLSTDFPGAGDPPPGSEIPPGGFSNPPLDLTGPGSGNDGVSPPPGMDTDFPVTGENGPNGVVPPPLGFNGPGSGGSGNGRGRGNGTGTDFPPPTGLTVDPETGLPINPDTGRPFPVDPGTGQPYDPDTGLPINFDPETGRVTPIDPVTGEPVSPDGATRLEIDPETGLPIDPDTGQPYPVDPDTGQPYDPDTGLPINFDPGTGEVAPIDPITGQPASPEAGLPITYDPETGLPYPIDPVTGEPITDGGGTRLDMDPATGLPIDPDTGQPYPVDPDTGRPYNPDTGLPVNYDPVTGQVAPIDPITGEAVTPDFTPPRSPGLDTNFPSWEDIDPINPVTGGPAEVHPDTGLPYPVDPETGEAIKTGFDAPPEGLNYPRYESGGPNGLNYPRYEGDGGSDGGGSGSGGGGGSSDRTAMFASPTGAGGTQAQAGAGGAAGGTGGAGGYGAGGMGSPMMPPMMPPGGMGGGGGGENRDRNRTTWLSEDEKVWGTDNSQQRSVLGRPVPGQPKKEAQRHEFIDAGADGGRTGTASHDDEGNRGRKRKPGIGNRRGHGQEQAGDGDGRRDRSSD